MAGWLDGIRRALFLGLVLIAGTTIEQAPCVAPLCDRSTLFVCVCETFYMKEYYTVRSKSLVSLLLDVTTCLELVVESVCMYQI